MRAARTHSQPGRRELRAIVATTVTAGACALGAGVLGASASAEGPPGAPSPAPASATPPPAAGPQPSPYGVGTLALSLIDTTRRVRVPGEGRVPRALATIVRYPAAGVPGASAAPEVSGERPGAPFPLIVFAHGFSVTPSIYARLLDSWTRAGFVVAAPVFPLESAHAPGGPDESDLINEPTDMSFVITRVLAESVNPASPLAGLIDPSRIAVAGQSDGGEAALAVAYSRRFRDARVRAALVLSGAEMSGVGGYAFSPGADPLLAVQGTADTINEPKYTYAYFRAARRPKYLLRLVGAPHLSPYTREQPQLSIVERVSSAFLEAYLEQSASALAQLEPLGTVPNAALLAAEP